jgi:hypothetical protein
MMIELDIHVGIGFYREEKMDLGEEEDPMWRQKKLNIHSTAKWVKYM